MTLELLDAFLVHARSHPELRDRLGEPLELAEFLALAEAAGYALSEADVIAAQGRAEEGLSDAELQARAAAEARRLRHFIPA